MNFKTANINRKTANINY